MRKNPYLDSGSSDDNSFYEASNRLANELHLAPYERRLKNIGLIMIAIGFVLFFVGGFMLVSIFNELLKSANKVETGSIASLAAIATLFTSTGMWIFRSGIDMQRLHQQSRLPATIAMVIFIPLFWPITLFLGIGYLQTIYDENVSSIFKNLNQNVEEELD